MAGRCLLKNFLIGTLIVTGGVLPCAAQPAQSIQTTRTARDIRTAPAPIIRNYPNGFTPDLVVHLYPEGQRVDQGILESDIPENQSGTRTARKDRKRKGKRGVPVTLGPGEANRTDTTEFYWERDGSLNAVGDSARIILFFPRDSASAEPATRAGADPQTSFSRHSGAERNGQMILICPGGGYNELMLRSEGTYAAQVMTRRGYSVGIICYRMPTGNGEIPLTDVQNAFRYCRHHAAEWGVKQIGIMGMSAGGHLAAMASTHYVDEATRPDFTILFYPVISADPGLIHRGSFRRLTGLDPQWISAASEALAQEGSPETGNPETPRARGGNGEPEDSLALARARVERYSPDRFITPDTPPALLFHSINDGVNPENSLRYYERLLTAGVKAELHIFPSGGHGWGCNTAETAGRDRLEPYRTVFYAALYGFLEGLRSADSVSSFCQYAK